MSDPRYKDVLLSEMLTAHERQQMVRLMEECAELVVAASKVLRFGPANHHPDDPKRITNIDSLCAEYMDIKEIMRDMGLETYIPPHCREP